MANTLLELWSLQFPTVSTVAMRVETSAAGDAVQNPLSETSNLDNRYTSNSPLPTGRSSKALAVLWDQFCEQKGVDDSSINHLTTDFGVLDTSTHGKAVEASMVASKYRGAVEKNVTIRHIAQEAIAPVAAVAAKKFRDGTVIAAVAAVKGQDAVMGAYTRGNYRLGSSNPEGAWGTFTGKPLTNGGEDIATISLQQYRDGMS